ncbi:MAG: hypothetical protein ACFFCI_04595 [Promethearchaeota archaeon]
MTETKFNFFLKKEEQSNQLDILYEIYRLKKVRKKLTSKLNSLKKALKSGINVEIKYKFEALKVVIKENDIQHKNLLAILDTRFNLFELSKNLKDYDLYIENLEKERKKRLIDLETFEVTKGYYLQQILDTQESLKQLKLRATDYYQELRNELINLEDQRIRLTAEKIRNKIDSTEFSEKSKIIEKLKISVEEKLAFLKVKILDYDFE